MLTGAELLEQIDAGDAQFLQFVKEGILPRYDAWARGRSDIEVAILGPDVATSVARNQARLFVAWRIRGERTAPLIEAVGERLARSALKMIEARRAG